MLEARGDRAALVDRGPGEGAVSGVRMEFETFSTGGEVITTPERTARPPGPTLPAFMGFDHLQSFYVDVEAKPTERVIGAVGQHPGQRAGQPIDEIFYENRGRTRTITADGEAPRARGLERVKVYQAELSWDDDWFQLDAFYRTGHLHWQFEGDFFGLYRNAYYGENIDIYNGMAPVGFEIAGKQHLSGWKAGLRTAALVGRQPAVC